MRWTAEGARVVSDFHTGPVHAIFRFYPAEWLPNLRRDTGWPSFFAGSAVPLSNPAVALVTQSKRFPLVWDELGHQPTMWRQLLPETRDPRDADWRNGCEWILKPALGRVGDGIAMAGITSAADLRQIHRDARWFPRHWAAQRRFRSIAIDTPEGSHHVCLGVFVIDGRAAGIYGRLARAPLIDQHARDVAVLVRPDPQYDEPRRTSPHVRPVAL
jgi:glutathionylspermidine synthase